MTMELMEQVVGTMCEHKDISPQSMHVAHQLGDYGGVWSYQNSWSQKLDDGYWPDGVAWIWNPEINQVVGFTDEHSAHKPWWLDADPTHMEDHYNGG